MKRSLLLTVMLLFFVSSFTFAKSNSDAKVIFLIGKVLVNGKPIKTGATIHEKDVIETDAKSLCQVQIGDKSIFQVGKTSRLIFSLNDNKRELHLEKGALGAVLNKGEDKVKFVIRTPALTAGVRGTSFYVESRGSTQSYFCVCNGIIYLEAQDNPDKGEEVKSFHHTSRLFSKTSEGKIKVQPGGLDNHNDKTIEDLASKIGVKIDWNKIQ